MTSSSPVIDLDATGLAVNGTAVRFPIPVADLTAAWGTPTRWDGEHASVLTWHDLGLYAHLRDDAHVKSLGIAIGPEDGAPAYIPTGLFSGTFRIDGTPVIHEVPGAGIAAERVADTALTTAHGHRILATYDGDALQAVEMVSATPVVSTVPRDKYDVRAAAGTPLQFGDLNLKLAVIDELMYQQGAIEPVFDLAEFVDWYDGRAIDVEAEAGRPIPEVLAYFERLEIDQALAEQVTDLTVDAGNEIYQHVAPRWDGEDDIFDVRSWDDLALLPRLESIDFISLTPDEATLQDLRDRGLELT